MECRDIRRLAIATGVLITLVACAAPVSPSTQQSNTPAGSSTGAPQAQRTLVAAVQREPPTLALRPIGETFASQYLPNHMFNADIAVLDDQGLTHPYMVEALPQLNTDSWQVFPDGMMQTTYQFLPNLTWQDGTAFSTQDYVFAWHVYTTPALGLAHSPPFTAIDNVTAPDDRTLVIHWTRPYPDAAHMSGRDRQFPALPRHLLQAAFESQSAEAFTNLSYWTRDYVGLGPYKVVSWEPGASIETSAFDGHATGRPKIDRIRLVFIADRNAALANALAGDVQLLADNVLQYGDAINLRQQWDPTHGGTVLWQLNTWRGIDVQARPAFVQPQALQDERIRAALFHAVDRDTLNNSIYGGVGLLMDYVMVPIGQWGPAVQQGVVPHPFDLRMSEQIMRDAGYEKGPDGFYTSPAAGRFSAELKTSAGPDNEKEEAAIVDGWRGTGYDISESIVPVEQSQDLQIRASYPGMYLLSTPAGDRTAVTYTPDNVALPENGWHGSNRSGWSDPDYTRLAQAFDATLDVEQRKQQIAQMAHIYSADVASISLYARPQVWAFTSALVGPVNVAPESDTGWNISQWEMR